MKPARFRLKDKLSSNCLVKKEKKDDEQVS